MVASAVFFLDLKGKIIIWRNYRGDVPKAAVEKCVDWNLSPLLILDASCIIKLGSLVKYKRRMRQT